MNITYEWTIDHEPGGMYGPGHWAYHIPFWSAVDSIQSIWPDVEREQIARDLAVALRRDWIKGLGMVAYLNLLNEGWGDSPIIERYSRRQPDDQTFEDLPLFAQVA